MDLGGFFKGKDGQSPDKSAANTPSATPPLQMVLSATKGATDAFSNVGRQVNTTIRRLSVKSTEPSGGHGIGFGYGFGVGSTAKPGVAHKFQSCFRQAIIKMMVKLGILPSFPFDQSNISGSLQSGIRLVSGTSDSNVQSSVTNIMQLVTKTTESMPHGPSKDGSSNVVPKQESFSLKGTPSEASIGSRSEMVIRSFLQSPILKTDETGHNDMAAHQGTENNMLQMCSNTPLCTVCLRYPAEMHMTTAWQRMLYNPAEMGTHPYLSPHQDRSTSSAEPCPIVLEG